MDNSRMAVDTTGLVKRFGAIAALDGLDLSVPRGIVYAVLGPNGSGKTTAIRVLASLIRPDEGSVRVLGHDVVRDADAVRGLISLTGQYAAVDEELTGRENLVLLARLLGHGRAAARRRASELLEAFGLAEAGGRQARTYSGGMRRRLDIAASLVVTPELLFLDEPTTGLDPRSRNQVWQVVRELVDGGTTVLLTTQYLEEADALADRIAVIEHGRVIAEGTADELKASVGSGALHVRLTDAVDAVRAASILEQAIGSPVVRETSQPRLVSRTDDPDVAIAAISALRDAGVVVADFSLGRASLDEVFLTLTGRPADVAPEEAPA